MENRREGARDVVGSFNSSGIMTSELRLREKIEESAGQPVTKSGHNRAGFGLKKTKKKTERKEKRKGKGPVSKHLVPKSTEGEEFREAGADGQAAARKKTGPSPPAQFALLSRFREKEEQGGGRDSEKLDRGALAAVAKKRSMHEDSTSSSKWEERERGGIFKTTSAAARWGGTAKSFSQLKGVFKREISEKKTESFLGTEKARDVLGSELIWPKNSYLDLNLGRDRPKRSHRGG